MRTEHSVSSRMVTVVVGVDEPANRAPVTFEDADAPPDGREAVKSGASPDGKGEGHGSSSQRSSLQKFSSIQEHRFISKMMERKEWPAHAHTPQQAGRFCNVSGVSLIHESPTCIQGKNPRYSFELSL